ANVRPRNRQFGRGAGADGMNTTEYPYQRVPVERSAPTGDECQLLNHYRIRRRQCSDFKVELRQRKSQKRQLWLLRRQASQSAVEPGSDRAHSHSCEKHWNTTEECPELC